MTDHSSSDRQARPSQRNFFNKRPPRAVWVVIGGLWLLLLAGVLPGLGGSGQSADDATSVQTAAASMLGSELVNQASSADAAPAPTATPLALVPLPTVTPFPTFIPPTPAATATPIPATPIPPTATVSATAVPATAIPATAIPATAVPATAVPVTATPVPPTPVPPTPVPPTPVPATPVPATATPVPTVAPSPTAAMITQQAPLIQSTGGNDAQAMIAQLNNVRAAVGLGQLTEHGALTAYATSWSTFMANNGGMSGLTARNSSPHSQFEPTFDSSAPGGCLPWGENVAEGFNSTVSRLQMRLEESPGHYKNMVDSRFDSVGIGIVSVGANLYITQIFGDC